MADYTTIFLLCRPLQIEYEVCLLAVKEGIGGTFQVNRGRTSASHSDLVVVPCGLLQHKLVRRRAAHGWSMVRRRAGTDWGRCSYSNSLCPEICPNQCEDPRVVEWTQKDWRQGTTARMLPEITGRGRMIHVDGGSWQTVVVTSVVHRWAR